ncbi:MAG TPA: hypothetical protein VIC60_12620 [Thermomicrobiales bacterium]|jgi:hypothetical protein
MEYFDEGEALARGDDHRRAMPRQGNGSEDQRHRLHIYRTALARLRAERDAGTPAARATWQVAHELHDRFDLDARRSALLVRCLMAAADEA